MSGVWILDNAMLTDPPRTRIIRAVIGAPPGMGMPENSLIGEKPTLVARSAIPLVKVTYADAGMYK